MDLDLDNLIKSYDRLGTLCKVYNPDGEDVYIFKNNEAQVKIMFTQSCLDAEKYDLLGRLLVEFVTKSTNQKENI